MAHKNTAQTLVALTIIYLVLIPIVVPSQNLFIETREEPGHSQAFITSTSAPQTLNSTVDPVLEQKLDVSGPVSDINHQDDLADVRHWIVEDENSTWQADELDMVGKALSETFTALTTVGLDGREILDGYKIRRYDGEYVRDEQGLVALVKHDLQEIILPDVAFMRLHGFSIYHELGHALDSQLDREMSIKFHEQVSERTGANNSQSVTAAGYWMRPSAQESREEAAADAFALWVTVHHAGMNRPIFAGTPLDVEYAGIIQAIEQALILSSDIK